MKVFDLICDSGHRFEGWFSSGEDYARQQRETLVSCPVCASAHVERRPSAAYLGRGAAARPVKGETAAEPAGTEHAEVAHVGAQGLRRLIEHVLRNTEDVGVRFPEEARKIHYGETAERQIRGTASPADVKSLQDEGIDILALPGHLVARQH